MENVKIVFQVKPNGDKTPNGYQCINYHMVFNIEMEDFYRKAHVVAEGHTMHIPDVVTHSSAVTREIVCIALTMAALHDPEIKAPDVLKTYVMALNRENILTVLAP